MNDSDKRRVKLQLRALDPLLPSLGGIERSLVDAMREKYPDGGSGNSWSSKGFDHDDENLMEMLDFAKKIGIVIPIDESSVKSGVSLSHFSTSTKLVQSESPFVAPRMIGSIVANVSYDSSGMPFAVDNPLLRKGRKFEIGSAFAFAFILVRGDARERIITAGLHGLSFVKLKIGSDQSIKDPSLLSEDWPEGVEPLYLLTSDIILPACKNWLYDNSGRVFHPLDGDFESMIYYPLNGRERMGPVHYSKTEIAPFLDYDIVKTRENYHPGDHLILVSKRFKHVFKSLGIKRIKYDLGFFAVIDELPWQFGTEGPRHPRYSGPHPNSPVD